MVLTVSSEMPILHLAVLMCDPAANERFGTLLSALLQGLVGYLWGTGFVKCARKYTLSVLPSLDINTVSHLCNFAGLADAPWSRSHTPSSSCLAPAAAPHTYQ
jgi:hypothetical protein